MRSIPIPIVCSGTSFSLASSLWGVGECMRQCMRMRLIMHMSVSDLGGGVRPGTRSEQGERGLRGTHVPRGRGSTPETPAEAGRGPARYFLLRLCARGRAITSEYLQ